MSPGPSRRLFAEGRLGVLVFCWLGWVFDFHDLILFSFTRGAIGAELRLDATAMAWIEGAGLFASALGGLLFGRVADRLGRRRAMTASILVYSAGALLTGLADGAAVLVLARLLAGLGVGAEWGIGHAVVADTWRGRDRDRVHGLLQAGSPVGMALAAVTGLLIAPHAGWRTVFIVSAMPALLVFCARRAMPGPDRAPAERAPAAALLQPAHRRATSVLLLILLLHMTGFWCVYAELPGALVRDLAVTSTQAGVFQLAVNAVHLGADVLFGFLAARCGRVRTFVGFCALFASTQLLLSLLWPQLAQHFTAFTVAAALMGIGAGTWSCFGALFGEHFPASLRATAASVLYSTSRGAQLFAKPMMAALAAGTGSMRPALWVGALCSIGSLLLVRLLPRRGDIPE